MDTICRESRTRQTKVCDRTKKKTENGKHVCCLTFDEGRSCGNCDETKNRDERQALYHCRADALVTTI